MSSAHQGTAARAFARFRVRACVWPPGFRAAALFDLRACAWSLRRAAELALSSRAPLIVVSASGGARMMEGALSLMQMAKISAALGRLDRAGIPFISLLTDPTTGGVTASFAMLGDVNIAEPKALIGFAGPNVIRETIKSDIPEGFQTSEFLLEHGFIDRIVNREDLRSTITYFLRMLSSSRV